uniref:Uncharacterized protein n=1 Tax=Fagus sylvatica TaxID=28930 RepID=A0A2N9H411_FAGSY
MVMMFATAGGDVVRDGCECGCVGAGVCFVAIWIRFAMTAVVMMFAAGVGVGVLVLVVLLQFGSGVSGFVLPGLGLAKWFVLAAGGDVWAGWFGAKWVIAAGWYWVGVGVGDYRLHDSDLSSLRPPSHVALRFIFEDSNPTPITSSPLNLAFPLENHSQSLLWHPKPRVRGIGSGVDVFKKLEKQKVLSKVEKAGLLTKAEELGFTLSHP